jgi:hypothetical protein
MDKHYLCRDQRDQLKEQMIRDLPAHYGLSDEGQWTSQSTATEERTIAASVKAEEMLHTFLNSRPKGAQIVVSKTYVRHDCEEFFACLNAKCGVDLTVMAVDDRVR